MKKANSTNFANALFAALMILFVSTTASAQCVLTCNNLVQISLDQDCSVDVLPDMILEGGTPNQCPNGNLVVEMKIAGAWVPAVVNSSHINQTIQMRVRDLNSGQSCWGYALIEDKLAPVIDCSDITLTCAVTNYTPADLNNMGIAGAFPDIDENCGSYTTNYGDTWFDLPCNGSINGLTNISAYVRRAWTVTDNSGNVATCTQFIYFQRRHIADVHFPADVTITDCVNPNTDPCTGTGSPYITDFGTNFSLYCGANFCEMNTAYTDQILPICDGTYKILRTWVVYDWCLPTSPTPPFTNPFYYIQVIKVADMAGPVVQCPANLTIGTNPYDCERDYDMPDVIIEDACSRISSIVATWKDAGQVSHTLTGSLTDFPGNNHWDPDTLGVVGIANDLPIGLTKITYTITDDCGNQTICSFNVTVEDDVQPAAICQQVTTVSIGVDGMVLVPSASFNSGSYDNCSQVYLKVRRMDSNGCQSNGAFYDAVKFCCSDINDTVTVVLRVYDVPVPAGEVSLSFQEEHSNECMVQVYVQDKLKPVCQSPANTTVTCENFDPSLWAYGQPTATDNCCLDTVTTSVNYSLFDTVCNRGTITRTFRAYDCGNNSSQCTQRIVVTYNQDYWVKFPDDKIITVCDGSGTYGEPTIYDKDCELTAISYTDEIFTVVTDACFKIERTWTIINWCTYNTNVPCTYVPNPSPNPTVNHPSNLPGPVVGPGFVGQNPANTVVKINSTDPAATNYGTFWSANANCYVYKQIIKIIDTQDPVIAACPTSPVEVCDLTPNDGQFWNQTYWWDATCESHDLCEAPTDLCITATDACSGNNINARYLLFLDLDGNGSMETVINSQNAPNSGTVNYNNAGNANYTGGEVRTFDGRGVPFGSLYRFALQSTTSGANKTFCMRWNTLNSPSSYTVPQLPYGTHKIKWFVEDGCGNESTCEYTFVVKDCKKPTVVCLNGLSINIMQTGMIDIWASDFLQYAEDNCTPADKIDIAIRKSGTGTGFPIDPATGGPQKSVIYNCDELGTQYVELWARDKAGNADFCETYILVQDNMGNCTNVAKATVAGAIKTEVTNPATSAVEDVKVDINSMPNPAAPSMSMFVNTNNQGQFNFNAIPVANNYSITPAKDVDHLNGVSTLDLLLINRHILGQEPLNTPYKMIAADANNSGSITTFDIVELRKLILGIYNELPSNNSWRFVKGDFAFPNPSNPFQTAFPEVIDVMNLSQPGVNNANFVAVKIGDVNNTAVANNLVSSDDRSAGVVYFDVQDKAVKAGEEVVVDFNAAGQAAGFQFTLAHKGLNVVDIIPGAKTSADNFAVFADKNVITTSVDGGESFSVKFVAVADGKLSDMIKTTSEITNAEAYNSKGERMEVAIRFNTENGSVVANGFELFQNTPNPVSNETAIKFTLPEAANATLTITNAEGRTIKTINGSFNKGNNTITISRNELESGILFYQLDTPTDSAVKKMIVIK